jgi:hypothetical protein
MPAKMTTEEEHRATWSITIDPHERGGFTYATHGAGLGVSGFVPTREALANIIAKTITEYLPIG